MTEQGGESRTVQWTPCYLIQHSLCQTLPVCLPCPLMVPRWLPKYFPQGPFTFYNGIICIHFIITTLTQQGVQEKTHACCSAVFIEIWRYEYQYSWPCINIVARVQQWTALNLNTRTPFKMFNKHQCVIGGNTGEKKCICHHINK